MWKTSNGQGAFLCCENGMATGVCVLSREGERVNAVTNIVALTCTMLSLHNSRLSMILYLI